MFYKNVHVFSIQMHPYILECKNYLPNFVTNAVCIRGYWMTPSLAFIYGFEPLSVLYTQS